MKLLHIFIILLSSWSISACKKPAPPNLVKEIKALQRCLELNKNKCLSLDIPKGIKLETIQDFDDYQASDREKYYKKLQSYYPKYLRKVLPEHDLSDDLKKNINKSINGHEVYELITNRDENLKLTTKVYFYFIKNNNNMKLDNIQILSEFENPVTQVDLFEKLKYLKKYYPKEFYFYQSALYRDSDGQEWVAVDRFPRMTLLEIYPVSFMLLDKKFKNNKQFVVNLYDDLRLKNKVGVFKLEKVKQSDLLLLTGEVTYKGVKRCQYLNYVYNQSKKEAFEKYREKYLQEQGLESWQQSWGPFSPQLISMKNRSRLWSFVSNFSGFFNTPLQPHGEIVAGCALINYFAPNIGVDVVREDSYEIRLTSGESIFIKKSELDPYVKTKKPKNKILASMSKEHQKQIVDIYEQIKKDFHSMSESDFMHKYRSPRVGYIDAYKEVKNSELLGSLDPLFSFALTKSNTTKGWQIYQLRYSQGMVGIYLTLKIKGEKLIEPSIRFSIDIVD